MKANKRLLIALIALVIATLAVLAAQLIVIAASNKVLHTVHGEQTDSDTYMDIDFRGDSTSKWKKGDFDLNGETVDLNGATIDEILYNNSDTAVSGWTLQINILQDCYINQAWNGEMEIHQYVGTEQESVQRLDLQNYTLDDVTLEYSYDGDLLIPLQAGDYVIYYPEEKELEISAQDNLKIGVIFYYLEDLDLSDYDLQFYYNRTFTQGIGFSLFLLLCVASFTALVVFITAVITYHNAQLSIAQQSSAISSMSDIYGIIYMVSLRKNALIPVHADAQSEKERPSHLGAREQILHLITSDAEESYKEVMTEFVDINTIAERLKDTNTIARDYYSIQHGWSRIRFFAMDRVAGKPLNKILFTIQDINEEKKSMDEINARISMAESDKKAQNTFLTSISSELHTPLHEIIALNRRILKDSADEAVKKVAKEMKTTGNMLMTRLNGILDFSKLEAGNLELSEQEYSVKEMLLSIHALAANVIGSKPVKFSTDVAPGIPCNIFGDEERLAQIILELITNAANNTEAGEIKLSVFGKPDGDHVHLLISVKDTGKGIPEDECAQLSEKFTQYRDGIIHHIVDNGVGLNLVCGLLRLMNTELKVISTVGEGSEFYFELDQKFTDATPVGSIDFSDSEEE